MLRRRLPVVLSGIVLAGSLATGVATAAAPADGPLHISIKQRSGDSPRHVTDREKHVTTKERRITVNGRTVKDSEPLTARERASLRVAGQVLREVVGSLLPLGGAN
ncbi:hypothetical protein QOM21_04840 [Streptomyces sp. Pv4-95]|uniref:hypothetical protein n=1 Tax=Streptomyces sp. Pv4-95 TaxID=3049543 RepID=UPI0038924A71